MTLDKHFIKVAEPVPHKSTWRAALEGAVKGWKDQSAFNSAAQTRAEEAEEKAEKDKKDTDAASEKAYKGASFGDSLVAEFVEGALRNKNARCQVGDESDERKLTAAGFSFPDRAKIAGALIALHEADFTLREAADALQLPPDIILAVEYTT